jgi:hypothetical protein
MRDETMIHIAAAATVQFTPAVHAERGDNVNQQIQFTAMLALLLLTLTVEREPKLFGNSGR